MCEFLIFNTQKRYEKQKHLATFRQLYGNLATFRQLYEKNSNFSTNTSRRGSFVHAFIGNALKY